ncbi:MAG: sigma-54-dependent Fis family transcriptional regulator [Planctomycetales bacterium]|nr:sigma-54-dependent Fis family transcriptional regulator [Planctomycetales bacterium]
MRDHRELRLDVWREACQHINIGAACEGISALLRDSVPLSRLAIFRVEAEHSLVARVAHAPADREPFGASSHDLDPASARRLSHWMRRAGPAAPNATGRFPQALAPLEIDDLGADARAFSLQLGKESAGVLVAVAEHGKRWHKRHEVLLANVKDALAAALANDRRIHEIAALREAAEADRRSLLRRLGRKEVVETIVGAHAGLRQVMERVNLICRSDAPVLLLGETGVGKEVIARAVHERSDRRAFPFIRVNCGAIPPELIDSQLFGHEKGAFTGAGEQRRGWFERADGGTLFLDEIGELPLDAQVRFLRVLQDLSIERVGGSDPVRVDVRVVAATHRDLAGMVQNGDFREDLWYRIAVFPILLPPLRDRLDDLRELAEHFVQRAATRFGLPPTALTDAHVALLRDYSWPGNIRELGAVMDRAVILGEGRCLEVDAALGFSGTRRATGPGRQVADSAPMETLDEAMRRHIIDTLRRTRGRIEGQGGAAELLDINPHTLRARMRKLAVDWKAYRSAETAHSFDALAARRLN